MYNLSRKVGINLEGTHREHADRTMPREEGSVEPL